MVEGLTRYAQGVYELLQGQDVSEYRGMVHTLSVFFESMDSKYYSELEGKPDDMRQLVQFLNTPRP